MKKIVCILFALMLIVSTAVPAFAATPRLEIPDIPEFSGIRFDIKFELPDNFWDDFKINWKWVIPYEGDSKAEVLERWMS